MPELPEVEVLCYSLIPFVLNKVITRIVIYQYSLRYPVPNNLEDKLVGQTINTICRIGKYILFKTQKGTIISHLGMSGNFVIKNKNHIIAKNEHVIIGFDNFDLCYIDNRRFGLILWTENDPLTHKLLKNVGIDPFSDKFTVHFLWRSLLSKKTNIKQFLMNGKIISGIGNIYANEILFISKINPYTVSRSIPFEKCQILFNNIRQILQLAIQYGGTSIRNYIDAHGISGSFQNKLKVYGKAGHTCSMCNMYSLVIVKINQRSTVYCPYCQK